MLFMMKAEKVVRDVVCVVVLWWCEIVCVEFQCW